MIDTGLFTERSADYGEERAAILANRNIYARIPASSPIGPHAADMVAILTYRLKWPECEVARKQAQINARNLERAMSGQPKIVRTLDPDNLPVFVRA